MQNVGHYLGARSCFLLNNPFKLLFFSIAWVVSLPFEKNKPKNSLIFNLKVLSKRPYYTSHFKVFFLCYFQIWPHTFEERLSVNSCYSKLLSKRERERGGEKKVYQISLRLWWLSQVSVQGKRRKSAATNSDSFWNFSAIEKRQSWFGERVLSPCSCSELLPEPGFP